MSFDITKHKWFDHGVSAEDDNQFLRLMLESGSSPLIYTKHLNKQDAIAIAKHFNLIREDYEEAQELKRAIENAHPAIVEEVMMDYSKEPKSTTLYGPYVIGEGSYVFTDNLQYIDSAIEAGEYIADQSGYILFPSKPNIRVSLGVAEDEEKKEIPLSTFINGKGWVDHD